MSKHITSWVLFAIVIGGGFFSFVSPAQAAGTEGGKHRHGIEEVDGGKARHHINPDGGKHRHGIVGVDGGKARHAPLAQENLPEVTSVAEGENASGMPVWVVTFSNGKTVKVLKPHLLDDRPGPSVGPVESYKETTVLLVFPYGVDFEQGGHFYGGQY
jgi:hypothetical protein